MSLTVSVISKITEHFNPLRVLLDCIHRRSETGAEILQYATSSHCIPLKCRLNEDVIGSVWCVLRHILSNLIENNYHTNNTTCMMYFKNLVF
jgi:hypothetical protein